MWMRIVANEFEVLVLEIKETLHIGIEFHLRQGTWLTGKLKLGLFDVVQVEVGVTCGVDEVTSFEARHLCHHLEQQGIRGPEHIVSDRWYRHRNRAMNATGDHRRVPVLHSHQPTRSRF